MTVCLLVLLLAVPVFPCGATQIVYGLIHDGYKPISNATVTLSRAVTKEAEVFAVIHTGSFGLYSAIVGPCPELYRLSVVGRRHAFEPVDFWSDGSGEIININVQPVLARPTPYSLRTIF
jgi:hypothetical protein